MAPYERWQYYNDNVRSLDQPRDYAANKTKAVAWFVSNCGARNGRLSYAKELSKFIQVSHWLKINFLKIYFKPSWNQCQFKSSQAIFHFAMK